MSSPPRPAYVLDGISPQVRKGISDAAAEANMSLADTIRVALCLEFKLDCPPVGRGYKSTRDGGATRMVLRVDQHLFDAIKEDSHKRGITMKAVILDVLEGRFGKELA